MPALGDEAPAAREQEVNTEEKWSAAVIREMIGSRGLFVIRVREHIEGSRGKEEQEEEEQEEELSCSRLLSESGAG